MRAKEEAVLDSLDLRRAKPLRSRSFIESLNDAIDGIIDAVRTQPNMRAHVLIVLLVMIMAGVLGVSRVELAVLVFVIGLVMVAEMLNTAVEVTVDLVTKEFHPSHGGPRHVAAGGVLIAAVASVSSGYLIFFDRLASLAHGSLTRLAATPPRSPWRRWFWSY